MPTKNQTKRGERVGGSKIRGTIVDEIEAESINDVTTIFTKKSLEQTN